MQIDYKEYSDEELIQMYRDGDHKIGEYLCNKYKNLVKIKARSMYILGAEPEDLIQEGMIGLFNAIRDYDSGRDTSFQTFANLCVLRQIYTAVESSNRKKNLPLNTYISLYADSEDSAADGRGLLEEYPDEVNVNPEQVIIDKESREDLFQKIEAGLTNLERSVLNLQLTGMGYVEIAQVLGRDPKSTDNTIQRIRKKIKKMINTP